MLCASVAPARAHADSREVALGAHVAGRGRPVTGVVGGTLSYGLGDALALRGKLEGSLDAEGVAALVGVDLTWAWDVLAWVPVVGVGPRFQAGPSRGPHWGLAGSFELRRYLSFSTSLVLGAETLWLRGASSAQLAAVLGMRWDWPP